MKSTSGKAPQPYLIETVEIIKWNPEFNQDARCICGHSYHRHFDSYEDMEPVGCKYCPCHEFKVKPMTRWSTPKKYACGHKDCTNAAFIFRHRAPSGMKPHNCCGQHDERKLDEA